MMFAAVRRTVVPQCVVDCEYAAASASADSPRCIGVLRLVRVNEHHVVGAVTEPRQHTERGPEINRKRCVGMPTAKNA
jgi:hypothetical protein